ncbi:MAG: phosphoribosylformylglycinamidine synthase subunit PurL [Candidatus Acidiferrum sp.]
MASASTEINVTPEIAAEHGLTAEEYARVKQILGREPNITELGIFSVMWSEHCSYKSSKVHLRRLPTRGKLVVQGPGENAGVVDIGDGLVAAFKIESHNHPSYVEPFQGATTGVGGILRDIFTMGARPIAVLDSLRFGSISPGPSVSAEEAEKNRRIVDGVIRGIAHYGNCFGVPTIGGEVSFEPCYSQNPLVNALALGIAKKEDLFFAKARGTGNPVIYVGAKTGRDGIHGASLLASAEFTEESKQKRPNVQVGDPFVEKLLLEACLEAMKTGAIVAIQDMGAAGLTCSTTEMASRGGTGIEIDLAKVPQRETGMSPYEIMLSESQERMLLVAEKGREREVFEVFTKWGLDAVVVGEVTEGGWLRIRDHGQLVAEIPSHPLAEEGPVYQRPIGQPGAKKETQANWFVFSPSSTNLTKNFLKLLASPAIASKSWITTQYDTMVRTNTLAGPGASDAAVVRIKGTPRALALATDGNGRWCQLNPRLGAMHAVAEAARNVACSGARPIAATNCLNFGSPEKPDVMWQFSEVIDGVTVACNALNTPITGGNVSFYNETLGQSIYPTPVMGILGVLDDAADVLKIAFCNDDDVILLLDGLAPYVAGESRRTLPLPDVQREFSSSEYSKTISEIVAGDPPAINLEAEKRLQDCLVAMATAGVLQSAHDVSDGGIAVTLAESCFASAPALGARVNLEEDPAAEACLFGERGARAVLSAKPGMLAAVHELARHYQLDLREIGKVTRDSLFRIEYNGRAVIDGSVEAFRDAWAFSLERTLNLK